MKRQPRVWETIFANDIPEKSLISRIYKIWLQLNNKRQSNLKINIGLSWHFPNEDKQMANNPWKESQYHYWWGICRSIPPWDNIQLLWWQLTKLKTTSVETLEPLHITVVNVNWCSQFTENSLAIPQKTQHKITIYPFPGIKKKKELKTETQIYTSIPMFTVRLCIVPVSKNNRRTHQKMNE